MIHQLYIKRIFVPRFVLLGIVLAVSSHIYGSFLAGMEKSNLAAPLGGVTSVCLKRLGSHRMLPGMPQMPGTGLVFELWMSPPVRRRNPAAFLVVGRRNRQPPK